jgi:hypothetical protein
MYCIRTSMWNFGFWDEKACSLAECNIVLTSRTFKCKQDDNVIYEKISTDYVRISVGVCTFPTCYFRVIWYFRFAQIFVELNFRSFPSNVKFTRGIYSVFHLTQRNETFSFKFNCVV